GKGKITSSKNVLVDTDGKIKEISSNNIIIATGSKPVIPPIYGLDTVSYHTTDTIFDINQIPDTLVIVGGGVIGVELANIFSSLDTKVTIVEMGDRLIPTEDKEASWLLQKQWEKKGIKACLNHQLTKASEAASTKLTELTIVDKCNEETTISTDESLIAVGRKPNVDVLEDFPLEMNQSFIQVDNYLETSAHGVFSVGDVIGNLQLAHVASSEGLTAVENLDEKVKEQSYQIMPRCIYTSPQIASVGLTEAELKTKSIDYLVHKYHFSGNGMAISTDQTDGFSKVM